MHVLEYNIIVYNMIPFGFVFFGVLFSAQHIYMYVYVCPSSVCRMLTAIANSLTSRQIGEPGDEATIAQPLLYKN